MAQYLKMTFAVESCRMMAFPCCFIKLFNRLGSIAMNIVGLSSLRALNLSLMLFAGSIGVAGLSGCATVGKDFAASRVVELKIGETTQNQVREMFGQPWRMGMEDGRHTWTYGKYRYSLFGPAETEDLVIRFDNNGTVRSYTFNTSKK